MWGFQLWVNLPAREKWKAPRYQDIAPTAVPRIDVDGGDARVLAGRVGAVRGPIDGITIDPLVMDVRIPAGGRVRHDVPGAHNAFAVVVSGRASFGAGETLGDNHLVVLGPGDVVDMRAAHDGDARVLLFAGAPIGEPVARGGPFVMNTQDEIRQAFDDYRSGRLVGG
jgi:hypothetical protein